MNDGKDTAPGTLLRAGTWIRQGPATLVLREDAWVVLVPGLRREVIEAAWTVLGEKPAPEEFLDRLVEAADLGSADRLTALLCGFYDGTTAVVGVKGTTPIAVYTAEGSQQIAGPEDGSFVLRTLEGVRRTAFGDLPVEDPVGAPRLSEGIVTVRGFVHATVDPAELGEEERAALAAQVAADGRSIEDPEDRARRAARPAPAPRPAVAAASGPVALTPAAATRGPGEMPPSPAPGGARARDAAPPAPTATGPNMFDGLFGPGAPASTAAAAPAPTTPAPSAPGPATPPSEVPPVTTRATPSPAGAPPAPPTAAPSPVRRRLVSTSLFERSRPAVPQTGDPARSASGTSAGARAVPAAADASSAPVDEQTAVPPADAPSSVPRDPESTGAYDDLFGATILRRIEDAAVRAAGADEDGDAPAPGPAPGAAPSPRSAAPETPAVPSAPAPEPAPAVPAPELAPAPSDVIDWVPGVGRAAPEIAWTAARRAAAPQPPGAASPSVHASPPLPGDERPSAPPPGSAAPARTPGRVQGAAVALPGLVCPNGHANSPERAVCRACAVPLRGETRTVARPPLGAVLLPGGGRFVLDRSAIVGRRPRASRVSGSDMPQLITVPSPQQDISRSHLELRLEGWHVVALDLGTTNGTALHREGYDPVRLRPREGVVLHDGDRLDLGDGAVLTFRERT